MSSASQSFNFRPLPGTLIRRAYSSADLQEAQFSLPTPGPVFVRPGACLPWSAGSDRCGGVELDVKRSNRPPRTGSPGRPDPGALQAFGRGGCRTRRIVCVVGWWVRRISIPCSKEQDYREFSNLCSSPLNDRPRKWEHKFGNADLPHFLQSFSV